MEEAKVLLGAPYAIMGTVMHGKQFGRTIGMPTANLLPPDNKLLPPNGVYYSDVLMEGGYYKGITNIGYKPTVSAAGQMGAETYIYDFDEEIYGREITIRLLKFKRPERHFKGKDELREQMMKDVEEGKIFHEKETVIHPAGSADVPGAAASGGVCGSERQLTISFKTAIYSISKETFVRWVDEPASQGECGPDEYVTVCPIVKIHRARL